MTGKTLHVIPNLDGSWAVKRNDATSVNAYTDSKVEAVKIGRVISQRSGLELVIHDNVPSPTKKN